MDNYAIADQLSLLSKLMDIHGENAFKSKSYSSAAFAIEKLPEPLVGMPKEKLFKLKGIGESVGNKVLEIIETGELQALRELIAQTPEGVLEMMSIKGLGPKKIHTVWKEMGIDTIDDLRQACLQNRVAEKKGFGEKTQQNILQAIQFQQTNKGKYLYAQVEDFVQALQSKLQEKFTGHKIEVTGEFRRQLDVIERLEWVTTVPKDQLLHFFHEEEIQVISESEEHLELLANDALRLGFYIVRESFFYTRLFDTTGNPTFVQAFKNGSRWKEVVGPVSEEEIFSQSGLHYIPPYLRESEKVLAQAAVSDFSDIIQTSDIKGLIHSHSNWSDGAYTIEQMAEELIRLGFEYLVISDHSKAAYYANGLSEQKILEQHRLIDGLNKKYAPFRIFKSIECDILNDGTMDYSNEVLSSFDLVIASVHSNLDMPEEKAMMRLMGAITNPYVTILGHMTGRLLLRRKGYPVDHRAIIEACAEHNVVIEINAHPSRLDIDWRWIDYALDKGLLLSVNPDAHALDEFQNIRYGVLVAQKGGLTKQRNLSSFSREEFERFLQERKTLKGLK